MNVRIKIIGISFLLLKVSPAISMTMGYCINTAYNRSWERIDYKKTYYDLYDTYAECMADMALVCVLKNTELVKDFAKHVLTQETTGPGGRFFPHEYPNGYVNAFKEVWDHSVHFFCKNIGGGDSPRLDPVPIPAEGLDLTKRKSPTPVLEPVLVEKFIQQFQMWKEEVISVLQSEEVRKAGLRATIILILAGTVGLAFIFGTATAGAGYATILPMVILATTMIVTLLNKHGIRTELESKMPIAYSDAPSHPTPWFADNGQKINFIDADKKAVAIHHVDTNRPILEYIDSGECLTLDMDDDRPQVPELTSTPCE